MDRSSRIKEVYGYAVCLIALVTLLFSAGAIVRSLIDLSNPIYAVGGGGPALSSFEAYAATYRERAGAFGEPSGTLAPPDTASVETLRVRWEALRSDRIARVRFEATRSIVTSSFLIILSIGFFIWHWRWLRGMRASAEPGAVS